MVNYILIDGSYFVFQRYYAIKAWWKIAKDTPLCEKPIENKEFGSYISAIPLPVVLPLSSFLIASVL